VINCRALSAISIAGIIDIDSGPQGDFSEKSHVDKEVTQMYLQNLRLESIKCFEDLEIDFMEDRGKPRLMTVVLGDNGVGKSTLLQAIAITLGGEKVTNLLAERLGNWVRAGSKQGHIQASIRPGDSDPGAPRKRRLEVSYLATGDETVTREDGSFQDKFTILAMPGSELNDLKRTAYSEASKGWLACGYGPFRRLADRLRTSSYFLSDVGDTKVGRFASLFGDDEGLIQLEDWLIELDRRSLVERREGQDTGYRRLHNQLAWTLLQMMPEEGPGSMTIGAEELKTAGLAPEYVKTTAEQGVVCVDSFGNWVPLSQLSDGYQGTMAWVGDLVRRLSRAFPEAEDPLQQEGVVLIDEIDIHLHPSWQRKILTQLRQSFPKIQFVVTTHSPLVAASARDGELILLKREGEHVVATQDYPAVQGWRVDQILTSFWFGLYTARDPETEQELAEYDELLSKRVMGRLTEEEEDQLVSLEKTLSQKLPAPGETREQRELYQRMQAYIERMLSQRGTNDQSTPKQPATSSDALG
jgi:predicted ATPase